LQLFQQAFSAALLVPIRPFLDQHQYKEAFEFLDMHYMIPTKSQDFRANNKRQPTDHAIVQTAGFV
jgi:hypothetical protein